jgi:methyl-accepting chemotaxis protein
MKQQNQQIKGILDEIKEMREGTIGVVKQIQAVDVEVEEAVFKETKDKLVKEIYDEIQSLKGMFDTIVSSS